ncbi:hypothetical protein BDY21DRAFT_368226 [Lineolata rhizophorae]|uniref:GPI anchored protein n=1 Tax=Lineolata rhizophorae TaxID=578093 RepID=A0A6A6PDN1_9PEZI|nr:hypothetical protein BDY21DRAFT_368226 [Lineolata rhizophorae]
MFRTLPLVLSALSLALPFTAAQSDDSTVVNIFLVGTDPQDLVASAVTVDGSTATLMVGCPPGTNSEDCGFESAVPITVGSGGSVVEEFYTAPSGTDSTFSASCSVTGTTEAVCAVSEGGVDANLPGETTVTLSGSDVAFLPVTVTAGGAQLQGVFQASSGASSGASATATATATATEDTADGTQTGAAQSTSSDDAAPTNAIVGGSIAGAAGVLLAALAL